MLVPMNPSPLPLHRLALVVAVLALLLAPAAFAEDPPKGAPPAADAATETARKNAIRGLRAKVRGLAGSPYALKKTPELLEALEALAALGGKEAGHAALGALAHPGQDVRDAACAILEREHDKSLTRPLADLLEDKHFRRDADVRKRVAHALAVMADPAALEPLATLLAFDEAPEVVAEAAEALAGYGAVPIKYRRVPVRRLVDLYESTWTLKESVRTEPRDKLLKKEAEDRYKVYGKSLRFALQALTGVQLTRPQEWRVWWNDNKKRAKWGRHSVMPDGTQGG